MRYAGECGYSIIAKLKTKESGRKYVCYRCSHKSTKQHCGQRYYLPESELAQQIKDYVQKVSLTDTERDIGLSIIAEWENENRQPAERLDRGLKAELFAIKAKIGRLSDAYLEEAFEIDEYKEKKNILVNQKRDIEEKMADFHANGNRWFEPQNFRSPPRRGIQSVVEFNRKSGGNPSKAKPRRRRGRAEFFNKYGMRPQPESDRCSLVENQVS